MLKMNGAFWRVDVSVLPMRRLRAILIVLLVLLFTEIVLICRSKSPARPSLILLGYARSPTNSPSYGELLLANTTRRTIWLFRQGEIGETLQPNYLEYHTPVWRAPAKPGAYAMVNSVRVGNFSLQGDKLEPGAVLPLKIPVVPGAPPKSVGITYYTGGFKDGNEFVESMMILIYSEEQGALGKVRTAVKNSLQRIKSKRITPHEVWCPKELWLSASNTARGNSVEQVLSSENR